MPTILALTSVFNQVDPAVIFEDRDPAITAQYQALNELSKDPDLTNLGYNFDRINDQVPLSKLNQMFAKARALINSVGAENPGLVGKLKQLFKQELTDLKQPGLADKHAA